MGSSLCREGEINGANTVITICFDDRAGQSVKGKPLVVSIGIYNIMCRTIAPVVECIKAENICGKRICSRSFWCACVYHYVAADHLYGWLFLLQKFSVIQRNSGNYGTGILLSGDDSA